MSSMRSSRGLGPSALHRSGGALLSVAVAVALFSRFGINGFLSRDEAIYAYGGLRLAHGVPPYVSIFDPKGPVATVICGAAVVVGRLVDVGGLSAIRLVFCGCAVLCVLATYLLALRLFGSTLAALTAGVAVATSWPLAVDALSGPDAKTPGVLLTVVAMWLMVGRRWAWGAAVGALAFLVWQPFLFYPAIAVLLAVLQAPRRRRLRAGAVTLAAAALPVLVTAGCFALAGAFAQLVEAALVFPLTGVERGDSSLVSKIWHPVGVATRNAGFHGVFFWLGMALLVVLAATGLLRARRDRTGLRAALAAPLVSVVLLTLLAEALYAATDFQSYPDLYPFLPYPALGLAGGVAVGLRALRRRSAGAHSRLRPRAAQLTAGAAVLVVLALLTATAWVTFTRDAASFVEEGGVLRSQQADACAVSRLRVPGTPVWSMGDPAVLVLTHRSNPDRFVYLESGVAQWKVDHLAGGVAGWMREIQRAAPSVVVVRSWGGDLRDEMGGWLRRERYHTGFVGTWHVFLTEKARVRAIRYGVHLTPWPTKFAVGSGGRELGPHGCR